LNLAEAWPVEPGRKTVRLLIFGRVQGVGYRAWTAQRARKLGLTGWVRNLADGSVECVAQGPRSALDRLVAACHGGPPLARVTRVESSEIVGGEAFSAFRQRPTESSD
jgi:acylphosphatase